MGVYDELSRLTDKTAPPVKVQPPAREAVRPTPKAAPKVTEQRSKSRRISNDNARHAQREDPRHLPSRDDIQEFTFRLRDELKVKVQAEVPHHWQKELEDVARELNVKKLELYRFIIGEFLGKVKRNKADT
jgi:hypothetical protein